MPKKILIIEPGEEQSSLQDLCENLGYTAETVQAADANTLAAAARACGANALYTSQNTVWPAVLEASRILGLPPRTAHTSGQALRAAWETLSASGAPLARTCFAQDLAAAGPGSPATPPAPTRSQRRPAPVRPQPAGAPGPQGAPRGQLNRCRIRDVPAPGWALPTARGRPARHLHANDFPPRRRGVAPEPALPRSGARPAARWQAAGRLPAGFRRCLARGSW